MRSADTSPDAHAAVLAARRRMTRNELVHMAIAMTDDVWAIAGDGVRMRHPDYDEDQVEWAVRRLRLGDDLFRAAFPDAPVLAS